MNTTCKDRIKEAFENRIEDLRTLWELYNDNPDTYDYDLGNLYEYGLDFDYIAPCTFTEQPEAYFRYLLSTGGPGDEFRFYADKIRRGAWSVYRIEYVFLDWFDGASLEPVGKDRMLLEELFNFFVDSETVDYVYEKAVREA